MPHHAAGRCPTAPRGEGSSFRTGESETDAKSRVATLPEGAKLAAAGAGHAKFEEAGLAGPAAAVVARVSLLAVVVVPLDTVLAASSMATAPAPDDGPKSKAPAAPTVKAVPLARPRRSGLGPPARG